MKDIEKKSNFFKALSEPVRLKIIVYILKSKDCPCICNISSDIKRDQSVIFRHIKILEDAGIITTKKENKCLLCCIKDKDMIKRYLEE